MTKELLQQALDALTRLSFLGNGDFPGNSEGNRIAQKAVSDIKQALAQQEQCGCREGECETKKDKTCRMTIEIAERDGIPEWTPAIGIECAISSLRDDAARLRDGSYTPLQIADDLDVIANDLAKCKPDAQQEQPASVDAYVGAREDAAIWKKRALEAEELNRKFIAELNGPTYLGEPVKQEQPAAWTRKGSEAASESFCTVTYFDTSPPYATYPAQEQPAQKPVAWLHGTTFQVVVSKNRPDSLSAWLPLFAAPPTQPALSAAEIHNLFRQNCVSYPGNYEVTPGQSQQIVKAVEAHCRGGAWK